MHRQTVTRALPYTPEQLMELVGDVRRYPEFVPWVSSVRIWNQTSAEAGVEQLDAEAEVRFAFVREHFATRVRRDPTRRQIDVDLLYGPFRKLHNRWNFIQEATKTSVKFTIEFEFKSRLLDALMASNAHRAANRIVSCFEARAKALYDQPSGAQIGLG